jgi:alpha-glucosidase (family GH31 glycosyl hydrolase)
MSQHCRYDASVPDARAALWKSVNHTLVANGIHMFWLDGDEIIGEDPWESPTAPLMDSSTAPPPSPSPPPPPGPPPPHTCTFYNKTDYNGGDVAHAPASSAEACCTLCWAHADCTVFTFEDAHKSAPTCWMKSHISSTMKDQENHTAGACNGRTPHSMSNGQTIWATGENDKVGTFFPYNHQLTFAEGIAKEKLSQPAMMLSRATTAGSWRLGGASWDGDHHCDWNNYLSHLYGVRFRQKFAFKHAIGFHTCSLESSMRVTNSTPLGRQNPLTVRTFYDITPQTARLARCADLKPAAA